MKVSKDGKAHTVKNVYVAKDGKVHKVKNVYVAKDRVVHRDTGINPPAPAPRRR